MLGFRCAEERLYFRFRYSRLPECADHVVILKFVRQRHEHAVCAASLAPQLCTQLLVFVCVTDFSDFIDEGLSADHLPLPLLPGQWKTGHQISDPWDGPELVPAIANLDRA